MAQSLQGLIGNFMFICVPSIIYFVIWSKYGMRDGKISSLVSFLFLSAAILLCMSFPYHYDDNYLIDFRLIPLVLGILYVGQFVGAALLAILFVYRFIIGGDGIYIGLLIAACVYSSLVVMAMKMRLNSSAKRFKALLIATLLSQVVVKVILLALDYISSAQAFHLIVFSLVQFIAIWTTVYLVEFVSSHFRMQKELQEIEKMKVMGQIAASVAHEIRNPLTTVNGLLQVFKEKELPAEKRGKLTDLALIELRSAINTISDYLTFAQPQITTLAPLDLSTELHHVVSVLTPYANMQHVALTVASDGGQSILGDSPQLRQSLINLVKNSIDASADGSVEITVIMKREEAVIRIQDTGCGMTEEQVRRLGTPYYSTKEKGTGLGTMVAFSIIRAMNGAIRVESEVNKGSVFEISFPNHPFIPKPSDC